MKIKDYYRKTTNTVVDIINKSSFIDFSEPDAAFYIFADISKSGLNDIEFSDLLLNKSNTAVTPGRSFGDNYTNFVRIAICGNVEDVLEGVNRVVALAENLSQVNSK
jgi:aspartate/methionine/tyrosine aminotransferase